MKKIAAFAGVAAIAATGAANAAFTGVNVVESTEVTGFTTYTLSATFSDPTENLLSISANSEFNSFSLSGAELYNDGGVFSGLGFEDFASPVSGPGDTYVGIGGDGSFSPGFLNNGGLNGAAVLTGSDLFWETNGGWFDNDPSSPEAGGSVFFAQITIADDAVATLSATVDYNAAGGAGATSEGFSVVLPAPGAMALLGLAGLAGTRRRRG